MSRHNKKNGIPDRWLDYKAVGKRLHGTRFIAFKVPLKQALNHQLPRSDVFGPWELLDALNRENQELGLIIDLTFTTRYYKLEDVPDSLLFVKIFTAGHEVPSDDTILSFKRVVRRFLRDNADNDKLIGVHCTHGLNRTGYLICRYLIDVNGMDPKQAIELFNSSRGHKIERQNYLKDLQHGRKRSNEGMEESDQEPMRGCAAHRPSESREERRPHHDDSRHHRSFPPRETIHRSHHHHHNNVRLSPPPLRPPPSFYPPVGAALRSPYRWTAPHLDSPWRRPPRSEEAEWSSSSRRYDDRRRAPPPPPLSRYAPRWTNESSRHDRPDRPDRPEEEWAGPRAGHRYSQPHRVNPYDDYWKLGD